MSRTRTPRRVGRFLSALPLLVALTVLVAALVHWAEHRGEVATAALAQTLTGEADHQPILLFAFQAADCPSFGALFEQWEALERSGAARVVGVMLDAPRSGEDFTPPELAIPLRPDLARAAEKFVLRLGYRRTPVSVLLDGGGRVRLALSPAPDQASQAEAARHVREQAAALAAESTSPAAAEARTAWSETRVGS